MMIPPTVFCSPSILNTMTRSFNGLIFIHSLLLRQMVVLSAQKTTGSYEVP
jgi:hypothetical protein